MAQARQTETDGQEAAGPIPPNPFEEDLSADSAPEIARLRAQGGVVGRIRLADGHTAWLPLRYGDIRTVFTDARFSRAAVLRAGATGPVPVTAVPGMLLGLDPPEHTRVRRLVSKAFSPRTVELKRPRIQQVVDELLDELREHGAPADLIPAFTRPLPLRVITEVLGVPYEDRGRFESLFAVITSGSGRSPDQIKAALDELLAYLAALIARKRATPADDLLSELIAARYEGDRLSEPELLMNTHLILVAGHDTVANHLANCVVTLLRHPDQLSVLRREPELIDNAVEELLRFVQLETTGNIRIVTEGIELSGVRIRAGESVLPMGHIANSDPEIFRKPRRLDLTRPDAARHMAFGYGPHNCPGAALAKLELQLALAALVDRFPDLELAAPEQDLRWRPGMVMRHLDALPVTWGPSR